MRWCLLLGLIVIYGCGGGKNVIKQIEEEQNNTGYSYVVFKYEWENKENKKGRLVPSRVNRFVVEVIKKDKIIAKGELIFPDTTLILRVPAGADMFVKGYAYEDNTLIGVGFSDKFDLFPGEKKEIGEIIIIGIDEPENNTDRGARRIGIINKTGEILEIIDTRKDNRDFFKFTSTEEAYTIKIENVESKVINRITINVRHRTIFKTTTSQKPGELPAPIIFNAEGGDVIIEVSATPDTRMYYKLIVIEGGEGDIGTRPD